MPLLRSPDGTETVDVPDLATWQHYVSLGATPVAPQGYTPPEGQPADVELAPPPFYADPVDIPGDLITMGAGGKLASAAEKGTMKALPKIGSALGRVASKGAGKLAGDLVGQTLLEAALDHLPALARGPVRVALSALKKGATEGAETVAEKAAPKAAAAAEEVVAEKAGSAASRTVAKKATAKVAPKVGTAASRAGRKAATEEAETTAAKKAVPRAKPKPEPEKGTAASRTKPRGASKPELERRAKAMEDMKSRKVAGEIKPKGSAASRAKAGVQETPRHSVQYYSKSKGQYINIEDMNQKHIEQAYRQLAATDPKKGSVARKVMDALLEEAKHRYKTTGIHIGQAS